MTTSTAAAPTRGLEVRSIDYIPLNERHGKVRQIGPLWFISNAQISTLAVGLISFNLGGNLLWSFIAIVLGIGVGTLFMAAHSSQGPRLGLPQMIQSRPQFGYVGALLVWFFVYLQYAGFNIFNTILAGQAMAASGLGGEDKLWFWVVTFLAIVIAVFGYNLIHSFEKYLTYITIAMLAVLTIVALAHLQLPADSVTLSGFVPVAFFAQLCAAAGYQISWAPYVSDYSRYLPSNVSSKSIFRWTFWGSALGGGWLMLLGTFIAASVGKDFEIIKSIKSTADMFFPGFGSIALVIAAVGLVSVTAINLYGGSLTLISSLASLVKLRLTVQLRVITILITAAISLYFALIASSDFLGSFYNFLVLVLYVFIPWTAVNLMDFFVVRKGHYAIAEIFKPNGIYGRWGWPGLISYGAGFVAMVPFFAAGDLYTGFAAKAMGGIDISLFIGLPVSAILYYLLTRKIDLASEIALAKSQIEELENESRVSELS